MLAEPKESRLLSPAPPSVMSSLASCPNFSLCVSPQVPSGPSLSGMTFQLDADLTGIPPQAGQTGQPLSAMPHAL